MALDAVVALPSARMRVFPSLRVLALSMITVACASHKPPAPPASVTPAAPDMSGAWERLAQGLPGTWAAAPDQGRTLEINYRLVSGGSALLETFGADPDRQTLSVYHPDGRALMLTHYCGQGNQVRLRASEASGERITFKYLDVTNVGPGQSIMHELVFVLGPDTLDRTEVYRAQGGAAETSVLRLIRRR